MHFVVGTKSKIKNKSVEKALKQVLADTDFSISSYAANSEVPETPWDKETYSGAKNRALDAKKHISNGDYYIGIESGLVERYGHIYEEAWSCVITKDAKEYFGYSSGLKVPDSILKEMKEHNLPHYLIFAKINDHLNKEINSDTWGFYSGKMILREISIQESLRNTLAQIFSPKESYYHK